MTLLTKIQNGMQAEPDNKGSASKEIEQLNKLPDSEKLKVLEYLQSLKQLHEPAK